MGSKEPISFAKQDVDLFLRDYRPAFNSLYLHGSYWINLANIGRTKHHILTKELQWAKKLSFTHMILHPGSAKGAIDREEGIDALASALNGILKREHDIKIVLENTAHGKMAIGSDMYDFAKVLQKLDHPDRVMFCIDTAHAFAYGYNVRDAQGQDAFIALLDQTIGIERIALLHVNDTHEHLGSCMDRHHMIGDGKIGEEALRRFVLHPQLCTIPMLMEPPVASFSEEHGMLKKVLSWHNEK
jgi:deoxyribonuclease-4